MDPHFQTPSSPYTLTWCHLSLSQQTFPVSTHLFLTYWKLLEMFLPGLPPHPPTSAHLKSPLNSVVMQTVNVMRVRARCWLRRGWVSNAAITSGGDSGWIIIKASPLPLMWTRLINTRLQGGTRQTRRRRMIGRSRSINPSTRPMLCHCAIGQGKSFWIKHWGGPGRVYHMNLGRQGSEPGPGLLRWAQPDHLGRDGTQDTSVRSDKF